MGLSTQVGQALAKLPEGVAFTPAGMSLIKQIASIRPDVTAEELEQKIRTREMEARNGANG